jgi:hypothetical protein
VQASLIVLGGYGAKITSSEQTQKKQTGSAQFAAGRQLLVAGFTFFLRAAAPG